ncbi:MAG: hypothetical protein Q8S00_04780 [Deltaproteobacteria bacterium]|nr:hypothetical protein [Deltaproteobacteria bacterium]
MPKKQKPNIASFRRWDLARIGTGVLMPRGSRPEPFSLWPPWLSKTFVNENLLLEDPLELREQLFDSGRHPDHRWGIVGNLLFAIEHNAKNVLKEQPLPNCDLDLENDDSEGWDYFASEISEDRFYNRFARDKTLTHKQKNAIAALRSIHLIRAASHAVSPHGRWLCDPFHDHTYDSLSVAKIIMETAILVMAAIRGELWEDVWPHAEKNMAVIARNRQSSQAANEAKKKKAAEVSKWCQDWVRQYYFDKVLAKELTILQAATKTHDAFREKTTKNPPAIGTITRYIRPLFPKPMHARKKPPIS